MHQRGADAERSRGSYGVTHQNRAQEGHPAITGRAIYSPQNAPGESARRTTVISPSLSRVQTVGTQLRQSAFQEASLRMDMSAEPVRLVDFEIA